MEKTTTCKSCVTCKMLLLKKYFGKLRSSQDGLSSQCRMCRNEQARTYRDKNREEVNRRNREHARRNRGNYRRRGKEYRQSEHGKEMGRRNQLRVKYGMTLEQHKQMYADQNGCCALCNNLVAYDKTKTDHDHETDKVRGLLCGQCNVALGMLGDTVEGLQRAIRYLE